MCRYHLLCRLLQMQSPGGERSVVCKMFVPFTEHKIDDFMKLPCVMKKLKLCVSFKYEIDRMRMRTLMKDFKCYSMKMKLNALQY